MLNKKEQASLIDMTKDILLHNENDVDYLQELFDSDVFSNSELQDLKSALGIITNDPKLSKEEQVNLINSSWKLNYYRKPPSPAEFIRSEYWLGPTAKEVYPYIEQLFIDFFDPTKKYRNLVLYLPVGVGKSFISAVINLYHSSLLYLMRNPKKFLNLSEASHIVNVVISITMSQSYDLILKPILNITSSSERYFRCKTEDQLIRMMKETNYEKICYTTATGGHSNSILRIGNLFYNIVSEPAQLLGLNIIMGTASELGWLAEKGGSSYEDMWRLYSDLKGRIYSRLGPDQFFARTIIDSSPNSLDNPIDYYIYHEAHKDPSVLKVTGTKWQYQPYLFPQYNKDKSRTFPVFKGNASKMAKVIDPSELKDYDINDIYHVPIDAKTLFETNVTKYVKDFCGFPSGVESRLITNPETIESLFTPSLKNFYTYSHAPSSLPPEGLLWDIVKKQFFNYTGQGNIYEFYRFPRAPRFISIDLAKKHDMATISMSHIERNLKGEKVYVVDFSLAIMSTKEEINLDSFKFLITDMIKYGKINVQKVSFDQYQSDSARQYLLRHDVDVINISVDRTMDYYMSFISYMHQKRVKMGRNLIMKNNLKSLVLLKQQTKMKIDHEQGEWIDLQNEDWDTSRMGYFGKDLSDSVVASIALCDMYATDNADYIWDEEIENKKINKKGLSLVLENLEKEFNLTIN